MRPQQEKSHEISLLDCVGDIRRSQVVMNYRIHPITSHANQLSTNPGNVASISARVRSADCVRIQANPPHSPLAWQLGETTKTWCHPVGPKCGGETAFARVSQRTRQ
jgi:hypothetical protein